MLRVFRHYNLGTQSKGVPDVHPEHRHPAAERCRHPRPSRPCNGRDRASGRLRVGHRPAGLEPRRRPAAVRGRARRVRRGRRSIVEFARVHGLRVAPQSTGHGAAPLASLEDAILVKTERMRRVEIDAAARSRTRRGWGGLGRRRRARGRAGLRRPPRLVAGRRRRGLRARRRHGLARAQSGPGGEQHHGRRGRHGRRRVSSGPTATTSPTSSGPCAAAAGTSGSSPRSSSSSSRPPTSTPARCSGRSSAQARC